MHGPELIEAGARHVKFQHMAALLLQRCTGRCVKLRFLDIIDRHIPIIGIRIVQQSLLHGRFNRHLHTPQAFPHLVCAAQLIPYSFEVEFIFSHVRLPFLRMDRDVISAAPENTYKRFFAHFTKFSGVAVQLSTLYVIHGPLSTKASLLLSASTGTQRPEALLGGSPAFGP